MNLHSILLFTNTLLPGGAEKQVIFLANALTKHYHVILCIFHGDRIDPYLYDKLNEKVKVKKLRGSSFAKMLRFFQIVKINNPTVLLNYLLFPNVIGGGVALFFKNTLSIGSIRSSYLKKPKFFINKMAHNYLNDYTVFNNYAAYESFTEKGYSKLKAIVIPNAVEVNAHYRVRRKRKTVNILSVGRFDPAKDYYTALKAICELKGEACKFKYTIIGWGPLENEIMHWVGELKLKSIVRIIRNPGRLEKFYLDADVFLQTSIYEGLSNTILEAMSMGLPLVITNVGDNSKLVVPNHNGYLLQPGDYYGISRSLYALVKDSNARRTFGEKSYNIVKNNYSVSSLERNYLSFFKAISEK